MKRFCLLLAACSASTSPPPTQTYERPFPDAPAGVLVPVLVEGEGDVPVYGGRGSFAERAPGGLRPRRELSGTLAGADLVWDVGADVFVTADILVPAGATLSIIGTHVVLGEHVDVRVEGRIDAAGALFTATGSWGGLHILGGRADIVGSWFLAGGDDPGQAFGHSGSQPVIFADGGALLVMAGGGVLDSPGKAFAGRDGAISLDDVRIARCDSGGEWDGTDFGANRLHISEIPDADGVVDDDDNDGLYFHLGRARVTDSLFARGEDDAIDHNGAILTVERVSIDDFAHEGVAASNTGSLVLSDVTIRGCAQGVEAGYGAPQIQLDHVTIEGNDVGVRFGDDYDMECLGHIAIDHSIVAGNTTDVRNFVNALDGPSVDAISIVCSQIGEEPACEAGVGARP